MYGRGTVGGAELAHGTSGIEEWQHRYMSTMKPGRAVYGVSMTSVALCGGEGFY